MRVAGQGAAGGTAGSTTGITTGLRRLWLAGVLVSVVGAVVPGGGGVAVLPGLLLLAVAAGTTTARARAVAASWRVLAWAVPVVPTVTVLGLAAWLTSERADGLAVVLLVTLLGGLALGVWLVFVLALVADRLRRSGRRFGGAGPAWKNDAIPPSYP